MATTNSGNFVVINEFLTVFDTSLNKVASLSTNVPFLGAVAFAFSPSGDKLYALSPTKQIIVFDTATWIATNVYPSLTERQVTDDIGGRPTPYGNFLQVSPDGKYLSILAYSETQILDLTKLLPDGGTTGNDVLSGDGIFGLDGDDTLTGSGLSGGRGNDTYIVSGFFNGGVNEAANHGIDQVNSSVNIELPDNVENLTMTGTASIYGFGNAADNLITGNAGANRLNGKEGQNTLRGMAGDDTLGGGSGNDIFDGGEGIDVASFANATAGVRIDLVAAASQPVSNAGGGTDQFIGIEGLEGSNFADVLFGTGSSNVLRGLESDDYLDGRGGTDILDGGNGSDTYVVYTAADMVIETDSNGSDVVYTKSDYTLAPGTSVEVLSTAQNDAAGNLRLTGNSTFQRIIGDYGANVLTGGGGRDTLLGLRGDDTYVIDTASAFPGGDNVVVENAGEGFDTIVVSAAAGAASFTLTAGSEIELLQAAAGTAAINITGNALAQRIEGNGGNNILNGGGGIDTLVGLAGNDQYLVRELGSVVIEGNGGGTDTVFTTVSYNLGVNEVEVLSTVTNSETTPIDLIGNFATQTVVGNNGNNVLNGGSGGAERLIGLRGNDVYAVGSQSIEIVENAGQGDDTLVAFSDYHIRNGVSIEVFAAQNRGGTEALVLRGNEVAQTVIGNAGNNVIDGRGSADVLVGDAGADTFAFTAALGPNNVDTIQDFVSGTDKIGLASDIFAGVAGGVSAGGFVIGTVATDADDRILYDQATGQLFYDADANGAGAAVQFAKLTAGATLSSIDFIVVAPVADMAV